MCACVVERARAYVCACGIIEKKCVHAAEDAGSAEEGKNNQKERMRQRETVIWNNRVRKVSGQCRDQHRLASSGPQGGAGFCGGGGRQLE